MSMTLVIRECRIFGGGRDRDGVFSILGEYEPETDGVRLLKAYSDIRVWYTGRWNGQFVSGSSTIECWPFVDYGEFELWPENEGESISEFTAEREAPVGS